MRTARSNSRSVFFRLIIALGAAAAMLVTLAGPASAADGAKSAEHPAGFSSGASQSPTPVAAAPRHSYRDQLGLPSSSTGSSSVMPYQPYTDWTWPASGYTSTAEALTIDAADPGSHYYWAYDFSIGGDGVGYTGLQTGAYPSNNKIALFAIWGADDAQGTSCAPFDGEGVGYTCRLDPFQWTAGRTYVLRVAVDGGDSNGTWYKATVRDAASGATTTLGRIHHPAAGGKLTGRGSWTEWFGQASATCEDLKRSQVRWGLPNAQDGAVRTTSHVNHADSKDGSTDCSGSTSLTNEQGNVSQKVGPK